MSDSPNNVSVHNQMDKPIWVLVSENEKHVIEKKTRTVSDVEFEEYYKVMIEGHAKNPIMGVPVDISFQGNSEFKTKLKKYYEENREAKYEWSGFIAAGELEIAPDNHNDFALKGDDEIYRISIRTTEARILADSVPRREETIIVDESGYISDEDPVEPAREGIENGMPVFFLKGPKLIGDPKTAKDWPCGTFGNAKGRPHRMNTWGGEPLKNNVFVRITTDDNTVAIDNYNNMYSTDAGNIYYDLKSDNPKQKWKISKVYSGDQDSLPEDKLYYGDKVIISNGYWTQKNLGINGNWLQCVTDDPTTWIIAKG